MTIDTDLMHAIVGPVLASILGAAGYLHRREVQRADAERAEVDRAHRALLDEVRRDRDEARQQLAALRREASS